MHAVADLKAQTGVTDDQLNKICTKHHLRKIASSVDNYLRFATRFSLPRGVLAGIQTDLNLTFVQKTERVFLWWRENMANPTYLSFVETCLEFTEGGVAREICRLCATIPTRKS